MAALSLAVPVAHADQQGVVFAMGGERFVLTPDCVQWVDHVVTENDRVHLRFDMPETPPCFGAFHGLLSTHQGERLTITFRGETLLEANQHTTLGPSHIVLESRHPRVAIDAIRYLSGLPDDEAS
ncbi:hypothetical protein [Halomonas ramblicola]|uniref:hypothetical protein n=1 Tax=Halomonas ramblicola TaxID=747349 RepID=UPI0025B2D011|nr:hypothetical protein [Halomonas ramblicola]MDN3519931.1 hypothetical protein [Halomonas ramblicola]